jgi:histidinol dehydrogenase
MIKTINTQNEDPFKALESRTIHRDENTTRIVAEIIEDVRMRGDQALLDNARKFDSPTVEGIRIEPSLIETAQFEPDQEMALMTSFHNVKGFHEEQKAAFLEGLTGAHYWSFPKPSNTEQPFAEPALGQIVRPLHSAGVYVPGGNAVYPSSVIMNAMPARIAGVPNIVVTTPCRKDGSIAPAVLRALKIVGVKEAFKIGGAAAIAALALGTESVPRVDKIVGPGNRFVNEAKRQLWGVVGLDGYAGPSEVCVLADETTIAKNAAIDLLTQIEHAPDNCGFLVCTDEAKFNEILSEIERLTKGAEREDTLRKALAGDSIAFLVKDMNEAIDIVNEIAPEHLSIATKDPEKVMLNIRNAGCILLGEWSPESAGDFCAGPSHTLPTSGAARFGSPVNVLDFLKVQSVINLSKSELKTMTSTIETFGRMEGFPIHGKGATIRFED